MLRSIVGGDRRALLLSVVALAPVLGVSAYASQGEGAASSPLIRNNSTRKKKEKELMTEEALGTEALVREGDEAFERYRDFIAESGPLPCMVRHPDAGGQCERPAVIEVYRLHFCEVHGAEAKAGALEELYHDAANFLKRLDNPHVPDQNPAALHALRDAVARLRAAEMDASERGEALKRSYPPIPERVLEDTLDFNYDNPRRSETPVDWHYQTRFLLHKLMRLAYEKGETWLVETLEQHREHKSAQLAAALVHHA